jgi:hypothetical protein
MFNVVPAREVIEFWLIPFTTADYSVGNTRPHDPFSVALSLHVTMSYAQVTDSILWPTPPCISSLQACHRLEWWICRFSLETSQWRLIVVSWISCDLRHYSHWLVLSPNYFSMMQSWCAQMTISLYFVCVGLAVVMHIVLWIHSTLLCLCWIWCSC